MQAEKAANTHKQNKEHPNVGRYASVASRLVVSAWQAFLHVSFSPGVFCARLDDSGNKAFRAVTFICPLALHELSDHMNNLAIPSCLLESREELRGPHEFSIRQCHKIYRDIHTVCYHTDRLQIHRLLRVHTASLKALKCFTHTVKST